MRNLTHAYWPDSNRLTPRHLQNGISLLLALTLRKVGLIVAQSTPIKLQTRLNQ